MLRILMFLGVGITLISAFALYTVSYQTRQIANGNQRIEADVKQLNRDIAILRAERAYLMRPERIEPLARKLGMRPIRGKQFISSRELRTHKRQR